MPLGRDRASEAPERISNYASAPQSVWHQQQFDPEPSDHLGTSFRHDADDYTPRNPAKFPTEGSSRQLSPDEEHNSLQEKGKRAPRVAGLPVWAFWTVLAVVGVFVVVGSIGGALGGTSVTKRGLVSTTDTTATSSTRSPDASSTSSAPISSPTQAGASTIAASPSPTSSALAAGQAIQLGTSDCPASNGTIYTPNAVGGGPGTYNFMKVCAHNSHGSDIVEAFVQTFDLCIAMCSNYNTYHESNYFPKCQAAVFSTGSNGAPPGNCWIKSAVDLYQSGISDATLLSS